MHNLYMKKICIVFGHHNINSSFNAEIRDTFIDEVTKCGHTIDLVNLFVPSSTFFKKLEKGILFEKAACFGF